MHDEDIEPLNRYVHENAKYVHMGVTLNHAEEMDVIANRKIVYKNIDIESADVTQFDSLSLVLTKMKLAAIVDGNEVVNPFVVTEVYSTFDDGIKMISMSYTRINY